MNDRIDKKIVEVLREEIECNISRLTLKSFARESNTVFRARLNRLESRNIITINKGLKINLKDSSYLVKLKENRKV